MKFRRRGEGGFTLIELLTVVVIIGILAAVSLPKLFRAIDVAKEGHARSNLESVRYAPLMYAGDHRGKWPSSLTQMFGPFPGGGDLTDPSMVNYFPDGQIPENPIDGPTTAAVLYYVWNENTVKNLSIVGAGNDGWVYFNGGGGGANYWVCVNNSDLSSDGITRYSEF